MPATVNQHDARTPAVVCHLLGVIDFDVCLTLQQRLVYESTTRRDGQITLLICEHQPTITIGRQGSRGDVHFDNAELRARQWEARWVSRGGGALGHGPGQLAVYPIVPLEWYGFSVGEYLDRLERGIEVAVAEEGFHLQRPAGRRGLWGRTGQIVAIATAVKHWVSYFGAYVNVLPYSSALLQRVDSISGEHSPLGCLMAERQQPARITSLRETLVRHVSAAFGCDRYHLYTGHPHLVRRETLPREASARVG